MMSGQNPHPGDMHHSQIPVGCPTPPPSGLTLIGALETFISHILMICENKQRNHLLLFFIVKAIMNLVFKGHKSRTIWMDALDYEGLKSEKIKKQIGYACNVEGDFTNISKSGTMMKKSLFSFFFFRF